jgi:putative CocE/NonD family hydrolase
VKNVPESNGKVGIIGSSYLGFTTLMAEINPHPALKAAVPESPMVDGWMGDDWFHNGAFRVSSLDYAVGQATNKGDGGGEFALGKGDDYTRWLKAGSVADFAESLGISKVPGVRKFVENPAYTDFWSLQAVDKWLAARPLSVPTMLEVGQWDQEDSYGAPAVYRALEPKDKANDMVTLVIGPWRHSGANHGGSSLGALDFTGDTAREWRTRYLKPFFDHWLKGAPDPHTPPVVTYATGINQWQESPRWPMGGATRSISMPTVPPVSPVRPAPGTPTMSAIRPTPCRSSRVRSTWAMPRNGSPGWSTTSASFPGAPTWPNGRPPRWTSPSTSWARPRSISMRPPPAPTATGWSS